MRNKPYRINWLWQNKMQARRIGTKSQTWASNAAALLMALQQQQARCVELLQKIDNGQ